MGASLEQRGRQNEGKAWAAAGVTSWCICLLPPFLAPCRLSGFANITAVYGVPIGPGRCRAIVRQPFRFKSRLLPALARLAPRFLGHLGESTAPVVAARCSPRRLVRGQAFRVQQRGAAVCNS